MFDVYQLLTYCFIVLLKVGLFFKLMVLKTGPLRSRFLIPCAYLAATAMFANVAPVADDRKLTGVLQA
ncbi:MAG: hypothetical protein WC695_11720, partial [Candidatus Omnitrophota bacterium]